MTLWEAIVLGIVQGATEFIPVSSSGHLVILPALFGWRSSLTFDVVVHWATTMAVLIYFRADWARLLAGAWQGLGRGAPWRDPDGALLVWILLASTPAALAGLLLEPAMEAALDGGGLGAARLAAGLLLVTGLILLAGEAGPDPSVPLAQVGPARAMLVGLAQALAILPGISRSGATIAAGRAAGLDRRAAARLSFLMSAPIILGAAMLRMLELNAAGWRGAELDVLFAGFAAAFTVGYLSIGWLMKYLRRASLRPFAVYCWIFGLLSLWLLR